MGRSVSVPAGAEVVAYNDISDFNHDEDDFSWEWDCLKDDFQAVCENHWPSFSKCDKWLGREDHALVENNLCYAGMSEYCGLVAYWVIPKEPGNSLAVNWCSLMKKGFIRLFGRIVKVGTASNGEVFFKAQP